MALVFMLGASSTMAKLATLVDPDIRFDDGPPATAKQIHDYIIAGADRYTGEVVYKLESDSNNEIRLQLVQARKHTFRVAIPYDAGGFQIKYLSSTSGLQYRESDGERQIHPNYIKWINGLVKEIKMAHSLGLDVRGEPTDPKTAAYVTIAGPGSARFAVAYGDGPYESPQFSGYVPIKPLSIYGNSVLHMHNAIVSCGPICVGFDPEGGRTYQVRWVEEGPLGNGGVCRMEVYDVSDGTEQFVLPRSAPCPESKSLLQRLLD